MQDAVRGGADVGERASVEGSKVSAKPSVASGLERGGEGARPKLHGGRRRGFPPRPYKRIGVEKGDERRMAGVDHARREVLLDGNEGGTVRRKPGEIAGRLGGCEVYRAGAIALSASDRIR